MIFNLYPRVVVKLGEERYEFNRDELRFTEVVEIEKATGLSFGEWQQELTRYSIMAIAGLLHMLRKRAGVPSDFQTLDFAARDLDVVPLHEDGTEFTVEEVAEDIKRRVEEAQNPVPTTAAPAAGQGTPPPGTTAGTSRTSPNGSTSGRGNGSGSPGRSSSGSKQALTSS